MGLEYPGHGEVLWTIGNWAIVGGDDFNYGIWDHLNSVILHQCDPTYDPVTHRQGTTVPRSFWGHLANLPHPCYYCNEPVPDEIQTLWILHNADCHD